MHSQAQSGPSTRVLVVASTVSSTILSRRSVRWGFDQKPIPPEIIEEIVACGLAAPSSKGARPWRLHVVDSPTRLNELADMVLAAEGAETYVPKDPITGLPREGLTSTVAESAEILRSVSVAIFVENLGAFSTSRRTVAQADRNVLEDILLGYSFEMVGIGAAVENMWLAAHSLGIEGAFMGDVLIAEQDIRRCLEVEHDLAGVLALGSVDQAAGSRDVMESPDGDRIVWHREESEVDGLQKPDARFDVFISYRHDSEDLSGLLIYNHLKEKGFRCFFDQTGIPSGADWFAGIRDAMSKCGVVLVIMNEKFFYYHDLAGRRRIDKEDDMCRREIEMAIDLDNRGVVTLIPVLLRSSTMPLRDDFPPSIRRLCDFNALNIQPADVLSLDDLADVVRDIIAR